MGGGTKVAVASAESCNPGVIAGGVVAEPAEEVEVLGTLLDEEEPFFKVLEAEGQQVFAVEDVFKLHLEDGCKGCPLGWTDHNKNNATVMKEVVEVEVEVTVILR